MKRTRTLQIERYIARRVFDNPKGVTQAAADVFGITRQAAHLHVQEMLDKGVLAAEGSTKGRTYKLLPLASREERFSLADNPREDTVWREYVADLLIQFPKNVSRICNHGFTEMFNNAIDHSEGTNITIKTDVNAAAVDMLVRDDGIGIFRKIQQHWSLVDEREALFHLTKGKLTTDPANHSGEGIFFTSRMFDTFEIVSGNLCYRHQQGGDAAITDRKSQTKGTVVQMTILGDTPRTSQEVFDQHSFIGESLAFSRTRLVVQLLLRQHESLLSRSQGKRLLSGVDGFREVVLDFDGVDAIGQAFADEVFRVFQSSHPGIELIPVNANDQVFGMIRRAEER